MSLSTNFTPLDSTTRYSLGLIDSCDWIFIESDKDNQSTKLEYDDKGGSITFNGYWHTTGFRAQLEKRYTGEDYLPFTEIFKTPIKMMLDYSKWDSKPSDVKKVKTKRFWKPDDEEVEEDQYTYPLLEGIRAEIEVYKREVYEDMSGEGFEDEEVGGRITLTPTYMNKLWFRFVGIEWAKNVEE
jgi:hypothetical protein